eukprot:2742224-Heterocapsa_arctica.AAC.1
MSLSYYYYYYYYYYYCDYYCYYYYFFLTNRDMGFQGLQGYRGDLSLSPLDSFRNADHLSQSISQHANTDH